MFQPIENTTIIKARDHYDRSKKAIDKDWIVLTLEEVKSLSGHTRFITRLGTVANAKVTSIKTWKTRPGNVDVHLKVGLYEYFIATYRDGRPVDEQLVREVANGL